MNCSRIEVEYRIIVTTALVIRLNPIVECYNFTPAL